MQTVHKVQSFHNMYVHERIYNTFLSFASRTDSVNLKYQTHDSNSYTQELQWNLNYPNHDY